MMNVQTGIVKYKDRTDIVCEYGVVGEKMYYFMPNGKLSNGNIIATVTLVEAIDSEVKHSTIGVIDSLGNEVIPFTNKSIKLIDDEHLLVERATPEALSVKEAITARSKPEEATRLVNNAALNKESLMTKMGTDGKFIFNDQFSEASIFTIDGANILNNQYYSFIGIDSNNIYYSTNVPEEQVYVYPLVSKEEKVVTNDLEKSNLDVSNVGISSDDMANKVEEALGNSNLSDNLNQDVSNENEIDKAEEVVDTEDNKVVEDSVVAEDKDVNVSSTIDNTTDVGSTESIDHDDTVKDDDSVLDSPVSDEARSQSVVDEPASVDENVETIEEDKKEELDSNGNVDEVSLDNKIDNTTDELNIEKDNDVSVDVDEFKLNDNYQDNEEKEEIPIKDSYYEENSNYMNPSYDLEDNYYEDNNSREFETDTIIKDTADAMTKLINQNKGYKSKIISLENRNSQLNGKISNLENNNLRLENQKQKLENRVEQTEEKVRMQENIINRQKDEISNLKSQLEGKRELVRLLNSAQSVLRSDNNSYDYDDSDNYSYRRSAA